MCMKCGCCTPNDKKSDVMTPGDNGGSAKSVVIVPSSDAKPGGYDYLQR